MEKLRDLRSNRIKNNGYNNKWSCNITDKCSSWTNLKNKTRYNWVRKMKSVVNSLFSYTSSSHSYRESWHPQAEICSRKLVPPPGQSWERHSKSFNKIQCTCTCRGSPHTRQISHFPSLWLLVPGLSNQFLLYFLTQPAFKVTTSQ